MNQINASSNSVQRTKNMANIMTSVFCNVK